MRVRVLAPVSHEPEGRPHLKYAPGEHDVPDELARHLVDVLKVAVPVHAQARPAARPAPEPEE